MTRSIPMNILILAAVAAVFIVVVSSLVKAKAPQSSQPAPAQPVPPGLVERDGQLVPGTPGA